LLLYLLGVIPVPPFSLKPTAPFGVPEAISAWTCPGLVDS
jgi:hypothetical protein